MNSVTVEGEEKTTTLLITPTFHPAHILSVFVSVCPASISLDFKVISLWVVNKSFNCIYLERNKSNIFTGEQVIFVEIKVSLHAWIKALKRPQCVSDMVFFTVKRFYNPMKILCITTIPSPSCKIPKYISVQVFFISHSQQLYKRRLHLH